MAWFYCFRQSSPTPPAPWVAQGPFSSYESAIAARKAAKAWDTEVGVPFEATISEEAQHKCTTGQGL